MSKFVNWCEIECYCDQCESKYSYEIEEEYSDFKGCQEELKECGWISRKINNEWCDFCCEECYQKYIENLKKEENDD